MYLTVDFITTTVASGIISQKSKFSGSRRPSWPFTFAEPITDNLRRTQGGIFSLWPQWEETGQPAAWRHSEILARGLVSHGESPGTQLVNQCWSGRGLVEHYPRKGYAESCDKKPASARWKVSAFIIGCSSLWPVVPKIQSDCRRKKNNERRKMGADRVLFLAMTRDSLVTLPVVWRTL